MIAIYTRVSTRNQDCASQEPDLKRWLTVQNDHAVWFTDQFTGKTMQRPGMCALMAAIARGEVRTVCVWRIDRLGRTAAGLVSFFETLQKSHVNLVSLKDGLDLSTPAGRLLAHVLASVASFETEIRAERVRSGQAAARASGKRWGGSKPGRLLTVTPEQLATVRDMRAQGQGVSAIARVTQLSRPTIYRLYRLHLNNAAGE